MKNEFYTVKNLRNDELRFSEKGEYRIEKQKAPDWDPEKDPSTFDRISKNCSMKADILETLLRKIEDKTIIFDNGDHWITKDTENLLCMYIGDMWFHPKERESILNDIESGNNFELKHVTHNCHKCGKSNLKLTLFDFKLSIEPCQYQGKFPEISIELDIPSGSMLIANVLHRWFNPWIGEQAKKQYTQEYSINHLYGQKLHTELQAKNGCAEFHIGNCLCLMYQTDDSEEHFIVGESGYRYEDSESGSCIWPTNYLEVADICTDYWGYYIVDLSEFERRAGIEEIEKPFKDEPNRCRLKSRPDMDAFIVNCKPGRYRFTHRYHLIDNDSVEQIYTKINRIGDSHGDAYQWNPEWLNQKEDF